MEKQNLENFYNEGFGWVCKNCEKNLPKDNAERSHLMTEGEAESKTLEFSNQAMAKWLDDEKRTLICPRCNLKEKIYE